MIGAFINRVFDVIRPRIRVGNVRRQQHIARGQINDLLKPNGVHVWRHTLWQQPIYQ